MRFIKNPSINEHLFLDDIALWGGELGATILTNHIIPEQFTIYTDKNWQDLGTTIGLVPDNNGKVEVLHQF